MPKQVHGQGPHDHRALVLGPSAGAGTGVFLTRPVQKGAFLAPFDGAIYDAILDEDLPEEIRGYPIQINPSQMQGSVGLAWWVNHSCQPNCGLRWRNGWYWITSRRSIAAGEELKWDYAMSQWPDTIMFYPPVPCVCGSARCRGFNLGCESLPKSVVREYQAENLFTAYILAQLRALRGL